MWSGLHFVITTWDTSVLWHVQHGLGAVSFTNHEFFRICGGQTCYVAWCDFTLLVQFDLTYWHLPDYSILSQLCLISHARQTCWFISLAGFLCRCSASMSSFRAVSRGESAGTKGSFCRLLSPSLAAFLCSFLKPQCQTETLNKSGSSSQKTPTSRRKMKGRKKLSRLGSNAIHRCDNFWPFLSLLHCRFVHTDSVQPVYGVDVRPLGTQRRWGEVNSMEISSNVMWQLPAEVKTVQLKWSEYCQTAWWNKTPCSRAGLGQ